MNRLRFLLLCFVAIGSLVGCKDDNNNPTAGSQTELLVGNNWQVTDITNANGQSINRNQLSTTNQILFGLKFEFRNNNTVRAYDPNSSNSIVNQGTWTLASDNKSMDVDVSGFKGNFPIIELNRSSLILRQQAPVNGTTTDINLVFAPSL
ncbi:DUF4822 domain-containing protein [Spirosoma sp. KUDC1026]|uniref:DUF4822 domain-containing protein n=1 Tax=Spirosoma sp. KUDC1026 TaxID=2745947 RepID=UPI00159BA359|nr:DUF4822 domain-containing protein [Spirosoma sp. KUDC1026]QKZ13799.1 DUF4822 domain-containing protein [Spirosoma sp. KUDC1026]